MQAAMLRCIHVAQHGMASRKSVRNATHMAIMVCWFCFWRGCERRVIMVSRVVWGAVESWGLRLFSEAVTQEAAGWIQKIGIYADERILDVWEWEEMEFWQFPSIHHHGYVDFRTCYSIRSGIQARTSSQIESNQSRFPSCLFLSLVHPEILQKKSDNPERKPTKGTWSWETWTHPNKNLRQIQPTWKLDSLPIHRRRNEDNKF